MGDDSDFTEDLTDDIIDLMVDDPSDEESRWWAQLDSITGGPPLTAAADFALGIALNYDLHTRSLSTEPDQPIGVSVSPTFVTLIALALVEALRHRPADASGDWFNVTTNPQAARARDLLDDDDLARKAAACRPPAGFHVDLHDVVTRPREECGTVPADVAADLDELVQQDAFGSRWFSIRQQARDALSLYCRSVADPTQAGPLMHLLRKWRVRRGWLDQPDLPPLRDPREPGVY
ncbi:hypothetical protein AB0I53_12025 [Saccharopolyspora sp. NPDC050389]|uniref:hypothetical protein n=1 Tax=Saccharopolyspora sp. NPDC050389 TaxID=3155516 RepID=UPI0033EB6828